MSGTGRLHLESGCQPSVLRVEVSPRQLVAEDRGTNPPGWGSPKVEGFSGKEQLCKVLAANVHRS